MNGLDMTNNSPLDKQTVLDHLKTELVCYSDPYVQGLGPQCRQDLNVIFFWDLNVVASIKTIKHLFI